MAAAKQKMVVGGINSITKTDTEFMVKYETGEQAKLNILNSHVFKYFMSPYGEFPEYPKPINPNDFANINSKRVCDYDMKAFEESHLKEHKDTFAIHTKKIHISLDKIKGTMSVYDKRSAKQVLIEAKPLKYKNNHVTQKLHQHEDEYFFGGGMQNGRFTHKGEMISIVNTNNWVDGGVTSPCPFYWSSYGYGVLRNTWQAGRYDFGTQSQDLVKTTHKGENFDSFYFINSRPADILKDYFELTGKPLLMPEYAFYEAHLNCFNRDYWVEVTKDTHGAILFEDGKYYKSYKPNEIKDKHGILESLNGEKNNYQFSARAVIDRYRKYDMPIGWFVPNDGYGAGYGQTDSLDGDIQNLKEFADYARENGIQCALWTESQLEPKDPEHPAKGDRDLKKEVSVAGIVAVKCDVAWIGEGYSFGLNAVEHATDIFMKEVKQSVRPMVIMVDGWAGTQRYAGIWSGDQKGGEWEYIRFHIPTYIGSGLSGQPVIGSDMDGIYAGLCKEVNIRDYQWKAFTPLQLNMDGWGNIPKTPFSHDEEATLINRAFLKLKSMLMPYNYTLGHESTEGLPMIRAMFLEFPDETPAYTNDSKYQFMWGSDILVAPVYDKCTMRYGIYLPDPKQVWIDFFTGEKYLGGRILNNFMTPLWKIPVFVKDGAILPMTGPHNNPNEIIRDERIFHIYPNGESSFKAYEDDGKSSAYLEGHFATTEIVVYGPKSNKSGDLHINVQKTQGSYKNIVKERTTLFRIMVQKNIAHIKAAINEEGIKLRKAGSDEEFDENENVFLYKEDFSVNPYLDELNEIKQKFLLIKIQKLNVLSSEINIKITGFTNESKIFGDNVMNESLNAPQGLAIEAINSSSVTLNWLAKSNSQYYEIERDGVIFTNITGTSFSVRGLKYESNHRFRIRYVMEQEYSQWSEFVACITNEDPMKNLINGVKVFCNLPCQYNQEISCLTDGDSSTLWHTDWNKPLHQIQDKALKNIILHFDLGNIYNINKIEYVPRQDIGNGTIKKLVYRYSVDGENWSEDYLESWSYGKKDYNKIINLGGKEMRFVEMCIEESIGGFGSGRHMHFFVMKSMNDL